jgi:hypothetical protein
MFTFYVTSDDGLRLWIDGQLIIDFWVDQGATERAGTARLQANHKHDIRLEYYENGGAASCKLAWGGPGVAKAIDPERAPLPARRAYSVHLDASYPKWLPGRLGGHVQSPTMRRSIASATAEDDARADFTLSRPPPAA